MATIFLHHREGTYLWRIFFTEWIVRILVHWLRECYDIYCMWHLPPSIVEGFSNLPFSRASGRVRNEQDLYDPFDIYSGVDLNNPNEVLLGQNRRKGKTIIRTVFGAVTVTTSLLSTRGLKTFYCQTLLVHIGKQNLRYLGASS